ncbi:MAG: WG repeat-containing protein [Clostridia bacterium]|nr:WG repeat-containing protein [Clostridia bacterium]
MELTSGEQQEKESKGRKIVIACIIIAILLIIVVVVAILVLKQAENAKQKLVVNGKQINISTGYILSDQDNSTMYLPIQSVANLVGYKFYNGEYKKYSEDKSKCYVECDDEVTMLEENSDIMYKSNSETKTNFDSYKLDKPVLNYNGILYASAQAIQAAFNTRFRYASANNTIYLDTLPHLVLQYEKTAKAYGYTGIGKEFGTQKSIIRNMLVVKKENKYGVISTTDFSTIIGDKYDAIKYIESTNEFIVTSETKSGILSANGTNEIKVMYDEIGIIDSSARLYYVKNNNLYGILNQNGKVLVYIENEDIGIDRRYFETADLKNDMFLFDNCIPLKKDGKWGLADKSGSIILNFECDRLGYTETVIVQSEDKNNKNSQVNEIAITTAGDKSINSVITIPYMEGIVICKKGKYGVVNSIGKEIIPCEFDKIYSITNEGVDEFYLEQGSRVIKLNKYLEDNKININIYKNTNTNTNTTTNNTVNNNNTTNSTVKNTVTNNATNN